MTAASEEGGTSESESLLQQHPHHSDGGAADRGRSRSHSIIEEYGSIAVAVVEQPDTHVPVVLHDLSGPMLLTEKTLQRQDSIISCIGRAHSVVELPREADILLLVQAGCGNDTSTNNDSGSGSGSTGGGQATIPSEIASMTKNLIGCGALSLCNGIARCANTPTAVFASSAWILLLGAIFGYFCWLIAKICHWTGRTTYRGCWQDTVGHSGSMLVSIINGLKATGANLAYATILADTTSTLLLSAGIQHDLPRNTCLLLVTGLFVLPLCLLKNLAVLAPFSLLGTFGIILTAVAMAVRYFDGSYAPGGQYHDHIDVSLRPSFGTTNNTWSLEILPFVCMVYEVRIVLRAAR
jgi:Transmembrane amino acid transporter protein